MEFISWLAQRLVPNSHGHASGHNGLCQVSDIIFNIDFYPINGIEVLTPIKKFKDKKTAGPDNIPSFTIKDCATYVETKFPSLRKLAKVCPTFKSGDKGQIENYRAMSLLCNFSKVFEIVLYNHTYILMHRQFSPISSWTY